MTNQQYLFDGIKAVPMEQLPSSAWTWYTPHLTAEDDERKTYYQRVPWLNRGIELRADAVSSLPFDLMRGDTVFDTSDEWENKVGFLPNPERLLKLVEQSLCIAGRAYLYKLRNAVVVKDVRYFVPTTIEPVQSKERANQGELLGFVRNIGGNSMPLALEDVIYFWPADSYVELGPALNSPCTAALSAAGVLFNVDEFATSYFKRGMIKVQLLTVEGSPSPEEKKRLKAWWKRVFEGIGRAWSTEVLNMPVEAVTIGEGVKELSDTSLTTEKREDIATALGVPQTLLFSNAANYATAQEDRLSFYKENIVPESRVIQATLNEQLFAPLGYRWVFKPETLDVFQADETSRSTAFSQYVSAGLPLEIVGPMLGLELPEGASWEQLAAEKEQRRQDMQASLQGGGDKDKDNQPPPPPGQQPPPNAPNAQQAGKAAMWADLRNWRTKAKKRGEVCEFESDHISASLADAIKAAGDVDLAFSFLKQGSPAQIEARIASAVLAVLEKWRKKFAIIIYENGQPPYDQLQAELGAILGPEITKVVTEQGLRAAADIGVEFDVAVVNQAAAEFARQYTFELVTGLTETTRKVVSGAIQDYTMTPGMTRGQLEALLEPAFGAVRAEMIAVTEVTRAYSEANNQYQKLIKEQAGVSMTRIWNTNNDELVCPVCGPLNQQPESVWGEMFPGGPPAHTRCRCFTTLRYQKS